MSQISALQRLQSLPGVFRGADLTVRFQWTSKTASQYLYLWRKRGLVADLGGHSDVFANLVTGRDADWDKALLMAMPSAVVIGLDSLRREGWITQIPSTPAVAVNTGDRIFKTARFEVIPRSPTWFASIQPACVSHEAGALNWLPPAWALADLLRENPWGQFGLWPDDVDWSMATAKDEADWEAACRAFGLVRRPLEEMLDSDEACQASVESSRG